MSSSQSLQLSTIPQIPTAQELLQSIKSLQKITPIDINSQQFKSVLRQYGEQHLILYKILGGSQDKQEQKFICFVKEQRKDQLYVSQVEKQTYKVDQLLNTVTQKGEDKQELLDQQQYNQIKMLKQNLQAYLKKYYNSPWGTTCHFVIKNKQISQIIIGLCGRNQNIGNYYSGQWTSYWNITPQRIQAKINVRSHFFENGNIIFHRQKPIIKDLKNQQCISFKILSQKQITKIIEIIEKQQFIFQQELQQTLCKNTLGKGLKKLRRINPITQSRMIWNVNAVLLSQSLKQTQKFFNN